MIVGWGGIGKGCWLNSAVARGGDVSGDEEEGNEEGRQEEEVSRFILSLSVETQAVTRT